MADAPYRFDELGWLQFQRVAVELLRLVGVLEPVEWHERLFGAAALLPDGATVPGEHVALDGPTLVLVAWARRGERHGRRQVEEALAEWERAVRRSVLVVTNARAGELEIPVPAIVLGPVQLAELVASLPVLRFRVPSLLGICDLERLVDAEIAARSTADIAAAAVLARVFVPTPAYLRALGVLERHRFTVLTGPPEMGKTAIARMLGLAALTDGWELHECIRPDELWARFDRDRRQVFVADDAFGSTEYRPDAAERWALELDRILQRLDDHHRLIWTSRPAPLKAGLRRIHHEHGVERFPRPAEVQVDAAALDVADKALILFRHAKAARLGETETALVRAQGWRIVRHEHFTRERIRRFVLRLPRLALSDDLDGLVAAEIREPTAAMAASFAALPPSTAPFSSRCSTRRRGPRPSARSRPHSAATSTRGSPRPFTSSSTGSRTTSCASLRSAA